MDYLILLKFAISYIQAFIFCMGYYQICLACPSTVLYSGYIKPVADVIALNCYDVNLIVMGIFVEIESAIVVWCYKCIFVFAFVPVDAEFLFFCIFVRVYVQFIIIAHCYTFLPVEEREYFVACAWLRFEWVGDIWKLSVMRLGFLWVCLFWRNYQPLLTGLTVKSPLADIVVLAGLASTNVQDFSMGKCCNMKRMSSILSLGDWDKFKEIALEMSKFSSNKNTISFIFLINPQSLSRHRIHKQIFIIDKHDLEDLTLWTLILINN